MPRRGGVMVVVAVPVVMPMAVMVAVAMPVMIMPVMVMSMVMPVAVMIVPRMVLRHAQYPLRIRFKRQAGPDCPGPARSGVAQMPQRSKIRRRHLADNP